MPEYECYTLLSETDRSEFLVHVFRALCLGGALCQYEDGIKAYMDATRQIYKELVRYDYAGISMRPWAAT